MLSKLKILKNNEIIRRYVVINSFDGALTILGIIIAEFMVGIQNPALITMPAIGAGIAMCISGIWGAYVAENAESKKSLKNLEKHMMKKLNGTRIEEKMRKNTFLVAIVDGLSPMIVAFIIITPFFLFSDIKNSYYSSFVLSAIILFLLGFFVGNTAGGNKFLYGFKMIGAGIIIMFLFYLLTIFGLM
ncbi:MAG: VIT1/CCC1 transporter family protein [Candidatus Aenigmarchaeota archaeon]|nr:VIT1/CCC1 transporter family protein [Candidatus Aenigmarchaeota archaeon]